jgi:predicted transcriptional regulator
MGRPPAGAGIDMEKFVTIWIDAYKNGRNQSDIARELGVTPAAVSTKAKKFREMGIDLPELNRGSSSNSNVTAAKQLMDRLLGSVEAEQQAKEEMYSKPAVTEDVSEEDYI